MVEILEVTNIIPMYSSASARSESFEYYSLKGDPKTVLSWPHDSPSVETMVKFGFFFQPTKKLKDRVKCFCCKKFQSTWKNVTDVAGHHLSKHPTCWYSKMNQYIEERENNTRYDWENIDIFNDALGHHATQTRINSFGDMWPFDNLEKANPTSKKMVDAGFYYTSQEEQDDLVICIYCGISLEGWELDDEPLVEHKKRAKEKGCYFLDCLEKSKTNSRKRESSIEDIEQITKKKKTGNDISITSVQFTDSSTIYGRPRPQRKAAQNLQLSEDFSESDSDEEIEAHTADESFGLSAHDLELNSEEAQYESSQKSHKPIISASSTLKNSSKANTSNVFPSPTKKSKILNSSFNNEDIFSKKNVQNVDIASLSPFKPIIKLNETKPLNDITNIPVLQSAKEQPNSNILIENESDSESEYHSTNAIENSEEEETSQGNEIFTSVQELNSVEVGKQKNEPTVSMSLESLAEESEPGAPAPEVSSTSGSESDETDEDEDEDGNDYDTGNKNEGEHDDSIILISNSKEIIMESSVDHSSSTIRCSPPKSKTTKKIQDSPSPEISLKKVLSNDLLKQVDSKNVSNSKIDESQIQNSIKSILSQPRFAGIPDIKRSRSPFLDDDYKGSDDISIPESLTALDDIPIEESTDHNIQIQSITKEKFSNSMTSLVSQKTTQNVSIEDKQYDSDVSVSPKESFDSIKEQSTPSKPQIFPSEQEKGTVETWTKTNIDKVLTNFEDLETAKEFLSEITKLPYELNDDVDGRVSFFINEMPDDELNMTVDEWLNHSAKQGKKHFKEICVKMLQDYDDECERALTVLKNLPVK